MPEDPSGGADHSQHYVAFAYQYGEHPDKEPASQNEGLDGVLAAEGPPESSPWTNDGSTGTAVSQLPHPPYPLSDREAKIIEETARFVREHGGQADFILRVKQASNPNFMFLRPDHVLYPYYRYLVEHGASAQEEVHPPTRHQGDGHIKLGRMPVSAAPGQEELESDEAEGKETDGVQDGLGEGPLQLVRSYGGGSTTEDDKVLGMESVVSGPFPAACDPSSVQSAGSVAEAFVTGGVSQPLPTASMGPYVGYLLPPGSIASASPLGRAPPAIVMAPIAVGVQGGSASGVPPPDTQGIIDKLVAFIKKNGSKFEAVVRRREATNPKFNFFQPWSPYHSYYRQQLLSNLPEAEALALLGEIQDGADKKAGPVDDKRKEDAGAVASADEAYAVVATDKPPDDGVGEGNGEGPREEKCLAVDEVQGDQGVLGQVHQAETAEVSRGSALVAVEEDQAFMEKASEGPIVSSLPPAPVSGQVGEGAAICEVMNEGESTLAAGRHQVEDPPYNGSPKETVEAMKTSVATEGSVACPSSHSAPAAASASGGNNSVMVIRINPPLFSVSPAASGCKQDKLPEDDGLEVDVDGRKAEEDCSNISGTDPLAENDGGLLKTECGIHPLGSKGLKASPLVELANQSKNGDDAGGDAEDEGGNLVDPVKEKEKMVARRVRARMLLAQRQAEALAEAQKYEHQERARAILHHRHFFMDDEEAVRLPYSPEPEEGEVRLQPAPRSAPEVIDPPPPLPALPSLKDLVVSAADAAAKHRAAFQATLKEKLLESQPSPRPAKRREPSPAVQGPEDSSHSEEGRKRSRGETGSKAHPRDSHRSHSLHSRGSHSKSNRASGRQEEEEEEWEDHRRSHNHHHRRSRDVTPREEDATRTEARRRSHARSSSEVRYGSRSRSRSRSRSYRRSRSRSRDDRRASRRQDYKERHRHDLEESSRRRNRRKLKASHRSGSSSATGGDDSSSDSETSLRKYSRNRDGKRVPGNDPGRAPGLATEKNLPAKVSNGRNTTHKEEASSVVGAEELRFKLRQMLSSLRS